PGGAGPGRGGRGGGGRGGAGGPPPAPHHYAVEAGGGEIRLVARIGPLRTVVASRPAPAGPVVLGIDVVPTRAPAGPCTGPDTVALGVEEPDGTFAVLGSLDGRYLSTEVAGGFTGRVIGLYAASGTVHFDWFAYEPLDG
ncbi:glycoside hydrolase family 43 protein, partial [Streptomyces sp. NPDC058369]